VGGFRGWTNVNLQMDARLYLSVFVGIPLYYRINGQGGYPGRDGWYIVFRGGEQEGKIRKICKGTVQVQYTESLRPAECKLEDSSKDMWKGY